MPDISSSIFMSPRKKKLKTLDLDNVSLQLQKPPLVGSAIVLDDKRYQRTIDSLLYHTDFGTRDLAKEGTRKWVQRSYAVVKSSDAIIRNGWDWGEVVVGTVRRSEKNADKDDTASGAVNILAVRKRPREEAPGTNILGADLVRKKPEAAQSVNVLGAGLVRKKEKKTEVEASAGINVLGAGLVRKKEKPPAENNADEIVDPRRLEPVLQPVNVLDVGLIRRKKKPVEKGSEQSVAGADQKPSVEGDE